MYILLAIHLAATAAYCTLLWTVQLLIYPQLKAESPQSFSVYHQRHTNRIIWIVGPLFLTEGISAFLLAWVSFSLFPFLQSFAIALFLIGNALTFSIFLPLHYKLGKRRSETDLKKLIRWNALRTAIESIRLILVVVLTTNILQAIE